MKDDYSAIMFNQSYNLDPVKDHAALVEKLVKGENPLGRHRLNVQIQTTSVCNGKCRFCPYIGSWHHKHSGYMSDDVYRAVLDGLSRYRIRKFCPYLENEPLADPKLFERIEMARERLKPEWVEVSSNMALLDQNRLEQLVGVLNGQNHEVWVSFHGADKGSYEQIMGLDFECVLKNVHGLVSAAQEIPLNIIIRGAGMPRVNCGKTQTWFGEREYRRFWEKELEGYEIKPRVSFFQYHDRADSPGLRKNGMSFGISGRDLSNFYCTRFDRWAHFLYTGEPILCCMDYDRETVFGGRVPDDILDVLYSSKRFHSMLRKGVGLENSPEDFICRRCVSPGG